MEVTPGTTWTIPTHGKVKVYICFTVDDGTCKETIKNSELWGKTIIVTDS